MGIATKVANQAPEAQGAGARIVPGHTSSAQHFGPFDPAARIAELEERIALLEVKVFGQSTPK